MKIKTEDPGFYSIGVHPLASESLDKELSNLGIAKLGSSRVYSGDAATSEYRVHAIVSDENLAYLKLKIAGLSVWRLYQ